MSLYDNLFLFYSFEMRKEHISSSEIRSLYDNLLLCYSLLFVRTSPQNFLIIGKGAQFSFRGLYLRIIGAPHLLRSSMRITSCIIHQLRIIVGVKWKYWQLRGIRTKGNEDSLNGAWSNTRVLLTVKCSRRYIEWWQTRQASVVLHELENFLPISKEIFLLVLCPAN